MYLEDDVCAYCGKRLDPSSKFAPHNNTMTFSKPEDHEPRPFFCSPRCIKILETNPNPSDYKESKVEAANRIKTLRNKIDEENDISKSISLKYELHRAVEAQIQNDKRIEQLMKENEFRYSIDSFSDFWMDYKRTKKKVIDAAKPKPLPPIPNDIKFEHALCLAASGGGKTTFMYHEIIENLNRADPDSMVIIDPKGTVVKELSTLACFDPVNGRHKDRLIIIDPSDYKAPPAFNVFKPANEQRYNHYDPTTREFLQTQIIELLAYTFSSRKQPLTGKQAPCFENVCRLILRLPNPDLSLLLDVLNDQQSERHQSFEKCKPEWKEQIDRMPPFSARFFKEQYYTNYTSSRDEIGTRLYGTLGNTAIQKVFGATHNKFDLFDALQSGKIIVVNVPLAYLGEQGTELFGRYMIAATLAAALERVTIPKHQHKPAFLYIDEFQLFADDEKTTKLLGLAREFSLGVIMFTHILDHFTPLMRAAVLTNTRIKYAARVKNDAPTMAKAMGDCDPNLLSVSPIDTHVQLACYIDGITDVPVILQFPRGAITKEPKMTDERHNLLLERNRQRVSSPTQSQPQSPPTGPSRAAQHQTNAPPPEPQPRAAPANPSPTAPPVPNDTTKLRDRTGALDWELTINPRIAEAGGEIPLVVQRAGQPVKINVKIPPLTRDNTVFRLAGLGHFRPDKTRGDLYLTIKVPLYPEQNTDWADKW